MRLDEHQIDILAQSVFRDVHEFALNHPAEFEAFRSSRAQRRAGEGRREAYAPRSRKSCQCASNL